MNTTPSHYNLPSRIKLEALGEQHLGIVRLIKSRIIRKDAEKIIETARQIKNTSVDVKVSLICTRNICSKSIRLLEEEGIGIVFREE
ncbi:hypothetical protein [Parabacteroides sp. FAFU027]|uniref:hypothetical protein n=1 Tax=Parabacteroides sp. FAFU027 TaxID=2922715 RepID=UPI001FAFC323|nr:hypothetical protein [Parabacteroides sp. FAFU027]